MLEIIYIDRLNFFLLFYFIKIILAKFFMGLKCLLQKWSFFTLLGRENDLILSYNNSLDDQVSLTWAQHMAKYRVTLTWLLSHHGLSTEHDWTMKSWWLDGINIFQFLKSKMLVVLTLEHYAHLFWEIQRTLTNFSHALFFNSFSCKYI